MTILTSFREFEMIEKLEKYDPALRGFYLIVGVGLCSNVYVLEHENGLTLVDTGMGDPPNRLSPSLQATGLNPENVSKVVLTHTHPDHIGGIPEILQSSKPTIVLHEADAWMLKDVPADRLSYVSDGDKVSLGPGDFEVLHTPGHTAGSICLFDSRTMFSGDTVFPGGYFGRVDGPTANPKAMQASLDRLTKLNVHTMLAGHGEPLVGEAQRHINMSFKLAKSYI